MPDGDIVHDRLGQLYQKPYKWLCEGKASIGECARAVMKALKEDIKRKGDLPVILAQQMADRLNQIVNNSNRNSSVDWVAVNKEFEKIVQQAQGGHYIKELTLCASKRVLHELRYNEKVNINDASESILFQYMNEVYKSGFVEGIPLTSAHYGGIDKATLEKRIEEIKTDIDATINTWVKKINEDGGVSKIRLPPRRQVKEIDMNEDLLRV
ncbi:MAG: hypothetical protein SW833_14335 [Cyanobacteriota bacterium]|nr:hypothetical protein [Cyanobacteriota bacterium]